MQYGIIVSDLKDRQNIGRKTPAVLVVGEIPLPEIPARVMDAFHHQCMLTKDHLELDRCAALTVIVRGDEVLAFKRADGHLGVPCGKVDGSEPGLAAAIRELREETGIEIDSKLIKSAGIMRANEHMFVHCFAARVPTDFNPELNALDEFKHEGQAVWMKIDEFLAIESRFQRFNTLLFWNLGLI